jgi:hypothetical protein
MINAYGATECSDDVATHRLTRPPNSIATVPIGRPIANTRLYVLDRHLQPAPIGIVGELHAGGISVGRGYLNDREQTRRSFRRDPFSNSRGARLYRTGDLARWRSDGTLECFGRIDHQVKIRGCRIELEEIEHALMQHAAVQSAVALARENINGDTQLVAYLVTAADARPKASELRDFLRTRLAAHMIPAGYVFPDHLPLTAHGKLDRAALAALGAGIGAAGDELVAPRNATEELLAGIWADLLGCQQVGVFSNFLDLGGHSLLAGRILAQIAKVFQVSLPIRALFEATTVETLARRIDQARAASRTAPRPEMSRVEDDGDPAVPIAPAISIVQQRVLGIERELPGLPQFNLPYVYRLQGPLNVAALEQSLAQVVRRHDSLRTGFSWVKQQPTAAVASAADISVRLVVQDLAAGIPAGSKRARQLLLKKAELLAQQEAWQPFEMTRAPLLRTRLLRLGDDDHVLILILHHIVVDGWSMGVLFEEISAVYSAIASGRQAGLPERTVQFSGFAVWQHGWCESDAASRQIAVCRDQLRGAVPVFSRNSGAAGARPGSATAREPIHFPTEMVERLNALGRNYDATLFMTLLAGFKTMLLARNGRRDICVATIMANRSELWTERVVGLLENTTLVRTRLDPDLSFREALTRVRDSVLDAYARQDLPFEMLASRLAEADGIDPVSLTQVFFVLQNAVRRPLELPDLAVRSFGKAVDGQPVLPIDHTWLTLILKEGASGLAGSCAYKDELFRAETIHRWMADYQAVLARAAANPEMSIGRLIAE